MAAFALFAVRALHTLVVAALALTPFLPLPPQLLLMHAMFGTLVMTHWYLNNDACFLTLLESQLTGREISGGFIHQIVAPIYHQPSSRAWYLVLGGLVLLSCTRLWLHRRRRMGLA